MEPSSVKRQKLCKDSMTLGAVSLNEICDFGESEAIAIKYYELDESCIKITYAQLCAASVEISDILRDAESSLFVGIASDIPAYCLPALMLGIIASGRAFVCLPSLATESERITDKLNVSRSFMRRELGEKRVIRDFRLHGERVFLARSREASLDSKEFFPYEKLKGVFAYATTTSGSTGEPKIVRATHGSIIPNILDLKKILEVTERDTVAQMTPLTFDPSIIEIFLSLSCKSTLFMTSRDLKNDSEILLKMLAKSKVSILQSTPSLFLQRWRREQLKKSLLGRGTCLRILLLGGEDIPSERALSEIRSADNETRIFDIYGITEVSCWASIREIGRDDFSRELGDTLSETIMEVRNEKGKRIEEGEGILYIGSNSRICAIDDEDIRLLNGPVFRDTGDIAVIDQDGRINLKGRRDRRIKRYGTKVWLTDLENHARALSFVEKCYALFMTNDQSLNLFFTIYDKSASDNERSRYESDVLCSMKKLSDIHRPDSVNLLKRFELTSNGKICKNSLIESSRKLSRAMANNHDELKAVKTFEYIWKHFLPLSAEELGFLDYGGTSVIALRVVNELEDKIGHEFPKLMGHLLRNENLKLCRDYISTRMSDLSYPAENFDNAEGSLNDKSGDPSERFYGEKRSEFIEERINESIEDSGEQEEYSEKILPWQKCRGRSNFSASGEPTKQRAWSKFTKIHLENRYDLGKCVDASPTIFRYPGGKNYVTVGSHAGIICTAELSKENSLQNWKVLLPNRIEASILVVDDFRGIVGSYDTFVYCIHLKTGEIFWKFKTSDIVKCTAVLCSKKQNVFFGSYDRKAYCVSLKDGSNVWSIKPGNGSICATPCISDQLNCVLFATLDGTCVSLKQNNGEINWLHKLDYPVFSAPIILDTGQAVLCDVSGQLNFISAALGQMLRRVKIDGNVFSHLHVHTDPETRLQYILFGSENKNIYKMECWPGNTCPIFRFTRNIDAPIASTPCSDGTLIVVAGNNGDLKILDFINGEILYNFKLGGDVFSSPIIHQDFIVLGCRDNHLYVLSRYDADQ